MIHGALPGTTFDDDDSIGKGCLSGQELLTEASVPTVNSVHLEFTRLPQSRTIRQKRRLTTVRASVRSSKEFARMSFLTIRRSPQSSNRNVLDTMLFVSAISATTLSGSTTAVKVASADFGS